MSIISHNDRDLIPIRNNYMRDSDISFRNDTTSGVLFKNDDTKSNSVEFRHDKYSDGSIPSTSVSVNDEDVEIKERPIYLFIQMQLCKRENLRGWLFNNTSRSRNTILPMFNQILDAVKYIHSEGLIHRDLKV